MANYLKENPWYIDTAVDLGAPNWGKVFVKEVRWENYAASSSLVVTTDSGGTLINEQIPATGNDDFQVMRFGPFGWVNSFNVTTITAGSNITVTITKA
jgi:hypothetical protein